MSWVDFNAEKLENYNWNHLDHYICTRGDKDFALTEALKYWRLRLCVLPTHDWPFSDRMLRFETVVRSKWFPQVTFLLLRFLDTCVNRVKHSNAAKKPRLPGPTSFRDRIGSTNRIPDRPRPRTTLLESKHLHQSTGDSGLSVVDHQLSGDEGSETVVLVNCSR